MKSLLEDIFDEFLKNLPPGHQNPQKAVMEQVLFNSPGDKNSDMRVDDGHFKVPIESFFDHSVKKMAEKIIDERECSFFKLE